MNHYYSRLQTSLRAALCAEADARPGGYRIALQFWIDPAGKVERFNNEVQIAHPDIFTIDQADDIAAVEPVYPATQGLTSRVFRKLAQAAGLLQA